MSTDKLTHASGGGANDPADDDATGVGGTAQINTSGIDDLLDDIDDLLEDNAEEFVRSYVQKGGQ